MAVDPEVQALALQIAELDEQLRALATARQLSHSTVRIVDAGGEAVVAPVAGAIGDALLRASEAKTTADGKNRIFRGESEPDAAAPFAQGDLWFQLDSEGQVSGIRVWDGTDWVPQVLAAHEILASGSITGPLIAGDAIDGKTITGALVRSSESGQRVEMEQNLLHFYGENGATGGYIQGRESGASGGRLEISATSYGGYATGIVVGHQNLPGGGSVYARAAAMWVDELYTGGGVPLREQLPPIGAVIPFAGSAPPPRWLLCDGSAVSRTEYAALFAVIGTMYGAGNGATTFNLPSSRGRVIVGVDPVQAEFDTVGKTGGEKAHRLTNAEMPEHSHVEQWGTELGVRDVGVQDDGTGGSKVIPSAGAPSSNSTVSTRTAGGGQAHNNLPPYLAMPMIIRAR